MQPLSRQGRAPKPEAKARSAQRKSEGSQYRLSARRRSGFGARRIRRAGGALLLAQRRAAGLRADTGAGALTANGVRVPLAALKALFRPIGHPAGLCVAGQPVNVCAQARIVLSWISKTFEMPPSSSRW